MTKRTIFVSLSIIIVVGLVAALWVATHEPATTPAGSSTESHVGKLKAGESIDMPMPGHRTPEEPGPPTKPDTETHTMTIAPERLQTIGVKFQEAAHRKLDKTIRTVGRVEIDERLVGRVNLKFEGWIEDLRVSAIGDHVKKDQVLFTIYSPDLVATQEEYLLALQSYRELGKSEFPAVSRGAKDLLEATRRRLQLWDIKENHVQDLERTGTVLRTLPIHSPISGTVIRMEARAGTFVTPGTELYFIADLSHIWVLADIYEYELPFIKKGQGATVTLSYDPDAKLHGHVAFIYPTLDAKTRTVKVRFELDNPGEKLKPDMYANVELTIPLGARLVVPRDAVLESGERQILFIHHGDGQLEWRNVTLGARTGDWVEVRDGLKEGEHVVTGANFLIDSESQLRAAVGGMAGMPGMK